MERTLLLEVTGVVAVVVVFFLVPLYPYQSSYYLVAPDTYNGWNSHVSLSYLFLRCGLLTGINLTEVVIGNGTTVFAKAMPSPVLACPYRPMEIPRQR